MTAKKKIVKKQDDAIAKLPLKYVVLILGFVLVCTIIGTSMLPRNVPPTPHVTVTAQHWLLPTMTQFPSRTPIPIFSATPYSPILDMMTQPVVQYFIMTELEVAYRGYGKVLNIKDIPSMYYPGTINPSVTIGTLNPYSKIYIEQTYLVGLDTWGRLASQELYIPLLYNGTYYTNWRPAP